MNVRFRILQVEKGFIIQRRRFLLFWEVVTYYEFDEVPTLADVLFGQARLFDTKEEAIQLIEDYINRKSKPRKKKKKFKNKIVWTNW